jgi:hypothetical protein
MMPAAKHTWRVPGAVSRRPRQPLPGDHTSNPLRTNQAVCLASPHVIDVLSTTVRKVSLVRLPVNDNGAKRRWPECQRLTLPTAVWLRFPPSKIVKAKVQNRVSLRKITKLACSLLLKWRRPFKLNI